MSSQHWLVLGRMVEHMEQEGVIMGRFISPGGRSERASWAWQVRGWRTWAVMARGVGFEGLGGTEF